MRIRRIEVLLVLLLLESCTSVLTTQTPGVNTGLPENTPTPLFSSNSSLYAPLSITQLSIEGDWKLFAHLENSNNFLEIKFDGNDSVYDIDKNYQCAGWLLPREDFNLICSITGTLHLVNIYTNRNVDIGITIPDWVSATANGRFLFYGNLQSEFTENVEIYDLDSGTVIYGDVLDFSDWYGGVLSDLPGGSLTLSADGDYFAVFRYVGEKYIISLIKTSNSEYINVAEDIDFESDIGGGLIWAPVDKELLIGLGNGGEGNLWVKDLYIFNPITKEIERIGKSTVPSIFYEFWTNRVWLPSSDRISANHYLQETWANISKKVLMLYEDAYITSNGSTYWHEGICVISLDNNVTRCNDILFPHESHKYINVFGFAWSPNDRYLAFIATKTYASDVIVYDLVSGDYFLVAKDKKFDSLYWK